MEWVKNQEAEEAVNQDGLMRTLMIQQYRIRNFGTRAIRNGLSQVPGSCVTNEPGIDWAKMHGFGKLVNQDGPLLTAP